MWANSEALLFWYSQTYKCMPSIAFRNTLHEAPHVTLYRYVDERRVNLSYAWKEDSGSEMLITCNTAYMQSDVATPNDSMRVMM